MGYSDPPDLPGLPEPPEWFSPWSYPSNVDDTLAIRIATNVALGATVSAACMAEGVSPSRATQWLRMGADAYERDAGPNDHNAAYLNFYLKIMQATGISSVTLQQELRRQNPVWWLSHHPEVRHEWGGDSNQSRISAPEPEVENVVEAGIAAPQPDTTKLRVVLKALIESGAMRADLKEGESTESPRKEGPIVDADAREEDAS